MEIESWFGLLAPAGTPMPVVQKLQHEVHEVIKTENFKEFTAKLNLIPQGDTSEEVFKNDRIQILLAGGPSRERTKSDRMIRVFTDEVRTCSP